jgi:hypothetical protein
MASSARRRSGVCAWIFITEETARNPAAYQIPDFKFQIPANEGTTGIRNKPQTSGFFYLALSAFCLVLSAFSLQPSAFCLLLFAF